MKHGALNRGAAVSVGICALLAGVGMVRTLSYSVGMVGDLVRDSAVGFLGYDPGSRLSVRFFKILATPSVVSLVYFYFRWRNAGAPSYPDAPVFERSRRIDFRSAKLRLLVTSLITAHWILMEWWKFNVEGFYPWSELEARWLNVGVLIASQGIAFWGMKYLSFEPLVGPGDSTSKGEPGPRART